MRLKCVKEIEGFTVGQTYKLLGVSGENEMIVDDNGEKAILYESYFAIIEKRKRGRR